MTNTDPPGHAGAQASSNRLAFAVRLYTYDDVFSHFDPRPYARRSLSDDLLAELTKARIDRSNDAPRLEFFMPASERNADVEDVVRERLHRHFQAQAESLQAQRQRAIIQGILLSAVGTMMLFGSALVRSYVHNDLLGACLTVLLEPGGWYAIWYGFDELFYGAKRIAAEHAFHQRMTDAQIVFGDG